MHYGDRHSYAAFKCLKFSVKFGRLRCVCVERIEFELDDHYDFDAFRTGFFCLHVHSCLIADTMVFDVFWASYVRSISTTRFGLLSEEFWRFVGFPSLLLSACLSLIVSLTSPYPSHSIFFFYFSSRSIKGLVSYFTSKWNAVCLLHAPASKRRLWSGTT